MRDVLFVEDMLSLLDLQLSQLSSFRGEVFNIGGGASNAISLREATCAMQEISSRSTNVTQSDKVRQGDVALYFTDNRKAWSSVSLWRPQTDLRASYTRIFEWIRENERNSALVMSLPHSGCAAPAAPDQLRPNATQAALPSPRAPYYHFNIDMTDKAIGWIQGTRSLTPNRPQSSFSGQSAVGGKLSKWSDGTADSTDQH